MIAARRCCGILSLNSCVSPTTELNPLSTPKLASLTSPALWGRWREYFVKENKKY